jgi:hypothetical protein
MHSGHRRNELEHIEARPGVEFIEFSLQTEEGGIFPESLVSGVHKSLLSEHSEDFGK